MCKGIILVIVCIMYGSLVAAQDAAHANTSATIVSVAELSHPVKASSSFYRTVYYDANWALLKNKNGAAYYRPPVIKDGERYEVEFFRMDNTLVKKESYLPVVINYQLSISEGQGIKDGHFAYYDASGNIESEGTYKNNKKHGDWKTYKNGKPAMLYYSNDTLLSISVTADK